MNNGEPKSIIDRPHFDTAVETAVDNTAGGFGDIQKPKMEKAIRTTAAQVNADFGRFLKSLSTDYNFKEGEEDAELFTIEDYLSSNQGVATLKGAEAEIDTRITELEDQKSKAEKPEEGQVKELQAQIDDAKEVKELVTTAMVESGIAELEDRVNALKTIIEQKDAAVAPQNSVALAITNLEKQKKERQAEKAKAESGDDSESEKTE